MLNSVHFFGISVCIVCICSVQCLCSDTFQSLRNLMMIDMCAAICSSKKSQWEYVY